MEAFFSSYALPACVFDSTPALVHANDAAERLLGEKGIEQLCQVAARNALFIESETEHCPSFSLHDYRYSITREVKSRQILVIAFDKALVSTDDWRKHPRFSKLLECTGEMAERIREYDWSNTELGPLMSWPQGRIDMLLYILCSPLAITAYTGKNSIVIYNDAYIPVLGPLKHPFTLGKPAKEVWSEIWPEISQALDDCQRGIPHLQLEHRMLWNRLPDTPSNMEEVHCNWSYSPMYSNGEICTRIHIMSEIKSLHPIVARRNKTVQHLTSAVAGVRTDVDLLRKSCDILSQVPYDLPYCLAYSCGPLEKIEDSDIKPHVKFSTTGSTISSQLSGKNEDIFCFSLQETVGLVFDSPAAPSRVIVSRSSPAMAAAETPWSDALHEMVRTKQIVEVQNVSSLLEGVQERGWPNMLPIRAVCMPLVYNSDISGCFIFFLTPALAFDGQFRFFLKVLESQLSLSIAMVKSVEEEIRKAEQLAALDRAKTSFFTSTSHELRTPLSLILGPARDMLNDSSLSKKQATEVQLIYRNSRRLLRLVNSILDFSRAEAGKLSSEFTPVPLAQVTQELAASFRSAVEGADIEYIVDNTAPKDQLVFVDLDKYERIVFNLISNAFKFTIRGQIKVMTELTSDGEAFILRVSDTGIGIPSDELSSIFEKFHRIEARNARVREGSGIGLSLCLELVKLHRGQLLVDSVEGQGSTFTVIFLLGSLHLPKRCLSMPTDMSTQQVSSLAKGMIEDLAHFNNRTVSMSVLTASETDETPPSSNREDNLFATLPFGDHIKRRALVADDNPDMRLYICSILKPYLDITEAADGEQAFELLQQNDFDILLTDVMMPKTDGLQLMAAIRADDRLRAMQIIILSAIAGEDASLDALRDGADAYLSKPFSSRELIIKTHQQLQLAAARSELEARVRERTSELEAERESFKRLADILQVGVHRTDCQGKTTWVNRKWTEVLGLSDDQWDDWSHIVLERDRERAIQRYNDTVQSGVGYDRPEELTIYTASKEAMDIIYDLQPESTSGGEIQGFIGIFTDVSALRDLERQRMQLEKGRTEEAETNRALAEQFIDVISHELRNPLNAIYHCAEMLSDSLSQYRNAFPSASQSSGKFTVEIAQQDLEEDLDAINTIIICAKHQKRIADDVLRVSKLTANLVDIHKAPFRPVHAVQDTLNMFKVETNVKFIKVNFVTQPSMSANLQCSADGSRFQQIIINLLSNAIKYTVQGQENREITVHLAISKVFPADQYETLVNTVDTFSSPLDFCNNMQPASFSAGSEILLHCAVGDKGAGMTKEEQTKVFKRFSQAKPKTHAEFGAGLGLWISRRLVELQGGKIVLHSKPDTGTVFRFYISATTEAPFVPSISANNESVLYSPLDERKSSPAIQRIDRPRILVVEDNSINQKVLCRLLTSMECDTVTANDGQECVNIMLSEASKSHDNTIFDLILMDLEMPVLDGLGATKRIRELEARGSIQRHTIVAVSANARQQHIDSSFATGMDGFLRKPYSKAELAQLVTAFCKSQKTPL